MSMPCFSGKMNSQFVKFDFQKENNYTFRRNYLDYTKKTLFCKMTITFSQNNGKQ